MRGKIHFQYFYMTWTLLTFSRSKLFENKANQTKMRIKNALTTAVSKQGKWTKTKLNKLRKVSMHLEQVQNKCKDLECYWHLPVHHCLYKEKPLIEAKLSYPLEKSISRNFLLNKFKSRVLIKNRKKDLNSAGKCKYR